jgi:hypothetical protein
MAPFFHLAYAVVIFLVAAVVAFVPGWALGLFVGERRREALLPALAIAAVVWIWIGWLGPRYGISRLGLVLFAGVGAVGIVYGWHLGLMAAERVRSRVFRRP